MKPLLRRALCIIGIHDNHKMSTPFESVKYCRRCMKVYAESTTREVVFWCVGLPAAMFLIFGILVYFEQGKTFESNIMARGEMGAKVEGKRLECFDCHRSLP